MEWKDGNYLARWFNCLCSMLLLRISPQQPLMETQIHENAISHNHGRWCHWMSGLEINFTKILMWDCYSVFSETKELFLIETIYSPDLFLFLLLIFKWSKRCKDWKGRRRQEWGNWGEGRQGRLSLDFRARIWNPGLPWFLRSRFHCPVSRPVVSSPSLLLPHDHLVHPLPVSLVSTFSVFIGGSGLHMCPISLPVWFIYSSWLPASHLTKDDFSLNKVQESFHSTYHPEHQGLIPSCPMLPKSLTEMKILSTDDLAAMSMDKLGSSWPVGWLVGWWTTTVSADRRVHQRPDWPIRDVAPCT